LGSNAPDERPLLSFRHVSKRYGEGSALVHALRDVTLDVYPRELVAIRGTSGSGKSTAMNIFGLLDVPTEGEYRIEDVPVQHLHHEVLAALRNRRFGFVFQGFNLLPRTTALENVEVPLLYADVPRGERLRRSIAALEQVGLGGRLAATPTQLSGGEQQRVAIARALVNAPDVLLADEPTGNLDSRTGREILELLTGFNRTLGLTILMVTHDADIARHAGRQIFFRDGALVAEGSA
jgi:putative ABC transport system ATP-binding protein